MATPDQDRLERTVDNPLRDAQRQHVREELEARLRHRGAALTGAESDAEVLALANAVDAFERAVMLAGGDLMVDTPESSQPEHAENVLPQRRGDEPIADYVRRIGEAAERLGRSA
jgi:hypothetical protein